MQIEERRTGDVTILALMGKLTLAEGRDLFKDKVGDVVQAGHNKLLIDLTEVPYVDSAGLGELVRTYTAVNRSGGQLKLLGLAKRIKDVLALTKLL
ncbi:MAG: STAS domain-containing protein, partial [Acidobacteria bacterium]|nr:STAS domain-containing protein [Acidobacteriota bacterium]